MSMLSLSPLKILIIVAVAVVLLGPDKVPQLARQLGAAWRAFREFHDKIESDVRQSVPDLPSTQELVALARSPISVLDRLAKIPEANASISTVTQPPSPLSADGTDVASDPRPTADKELDDDLQASAPMNPSFVLPENPSMN